ncbi:hypothetical protein [Sporohalobacter salinus]|uniref:hypothetical protein n=1 Tax=Sporohalobacter salinus TaxID=1494606 RepID=UPI001961499B|nr:hypothetical protein [Sporohalobacter salinus]MBM7624245.1 putative metal-dependent hydrolase [Sporohalobacter salinus]
MYLKLKIIISMTFMFFCLISLTSYILLGKGEKIIRASNKKFRFNRLISAIIFGLFISIQMLYPLLLFFLIKQKISTEIITGISVILFIIGLIVLMKLLFVTSKRKKVFTKFKKKVSTSIEYRITKLSCYFQGMIGLIAMGYFLLIGDNDLSYIMNIVIGSIAMVIGLIRMIRGLKVPKVITNDIYIKHNVSCFLTQFLKWKEVNSIKAKRGLFGIRSITVISYHQQESGTDKRGKRRIDKKMIISNLEDMKGLIEEIIRRTNHVVLDEKLEDIGDEIKNYSNV